MKRKFNRIDHLIEQYRLTHKRASKRLAKYVVLDELFNDLPDGAYFAAMEEYGYTAEDIIELNERIRR